ncbi:MAG: hypothetical protein QXE28_00425 [Desulfurococcaceae archaeon]
MLSHTMNTSITSVKPMAENSADYMNRLCAPLSLLTTLIAMLNTIN